MDGQQRRQPEPVPRIGVVGSPHADAAADAWRAAVSPRPRRPTGRPTENLAVSSRLGTMAPRPPWRPHAARGGAARPRGAAPRSRGPSVTTVAPTVRSVQRTPRASSPTASDTTSRGAAGEERGSGAPAGRHPHGTAHGRCLTARIGAPSRARPLSGRQLSGAPARRRRMRVSCTRPASVQHRLGCLTSLLAFYILCPIKMRSLQLKFNLSTWGGRRPGAGRKLAGQRAGVSHHGRAPLDPRHPAHVTLRAVRDLPSLRDARLFSRLREALSAASRRTFRVVHFSVQSNHVHLLVEADGGRALARGMQGLGVRLARAVNRVLGRRGSVWADRYHARALTTPREVRNGLVYVLANWRKHGVHGRGIDPCSAGAWFAEWRPADASPSGPTPVARPQTWLLGLGWRRGGPISIEDAPKGRL